MIGFTHDAAFFREEIEWLSLMLTQPVSIDTRLQLHRELDSAREHLADLEKGKRK
jgi:hypothetical protein